jgi:glucose/mannose-6-phosphate isomerase
MQDKEILKLTTKEVFKKIKDNLEKEYDFSEFKKIYVHGMGASGIVGDFLRDYFHNNDNLITREVFVNKSYEIPKFLDKDWLNIFISYSGKTEETLEGLKQSLNNNFNTVFITTNEEAKTLYQKNNYFPYITPKTEYPPRYNLASLLSSTLLLFYDKKEVNDFFNFKDFDLNLANKIVEKLEDKIPVVYSDYKTKAVPLRIEQQFNENSKKHCIHGYFSEVNHNHLEVDENNNLIYVFLRHNREHERISERFEIVKELYDKKGYEYIEIKSKEDDLLKTMLYFVNLFDFVTIKLGVLKGKQFDKNPQISYLKQVLSKK